MTIRLAFTTALILTIAPVTLHGQVERRNAFTLVRATEAETVGWQRATQSRACARHRHLGLGLTLGFVTGTLAGIAIESGGPHGEGRTLNQLRGAIGGALVGTIIGGTVGFFWRSDK